MKALFINNSKTDILCKCFPYFFEQNILIFNHCKKKNWIKQIHFYQRANKIFVILKKNSLEKQYHNNVTNNSQV